MEFDKSRVYTALNADELKAGSKVIVADSLANLKKHVKSDNQELVYTIDYILDDDNAYRFVAKNYTWALAYLISEPEEKKLKWTDLKLLDRIRRKDGTEEGIVIHIKNDGTMHICCARWLSAEELEEWEKVDE